MRKEWRGQEEGRADAFSQQGIWQRGNDCQSVCLPWLKVVTDVSSRFVLVSLSFSRYSLLTRYMASFNLCSHPLPFLFSFFCIFSCFISVVFHRNRRRSLNPRPRRMSPFTRSQLEHRPKTLYAGAETQIASHSLSLSLSIPHTYTQSYTHLQDLPDHIYLQYGQHSLTPKTHPHTQYGAVL